MPIAVNSPNNGSVSPDKATTNPNGQANMINMAIQGFFIPIVRAVLKTRNDEMAETIRLNALIPSNPN